MDYIALSGVNYFLKRREKLWKLFLIAGLASGISLLVHIYIINVGLRTIILHFGLNTAMTGFAFRWKDKRSFLENWFVIYLTILFLGGVMEWEHSLGIPVSFFWIKAVIAAGLLSAGTICLGQKREIMEQIFQIDILHRGKVWELNAYWDSGNLLIDPYNGKPVNILQANFAKEIFSDTKDYKRLIPYCSLGNKNGLLSVYSAEKMRIYQGEKLLEIEPAIFGVAEQGLLEGKEYDVILQASVIERGR